MYNLSVQIISFNKGGIKEDIARLLRGLKIRYLTPIKIKLVFIIISA